ncbi:MAG: hypothetical protein HY360_26660 [Verrucomicrobia bacterium]|nr:hypothetical protein [Verrucomicrobiota bacterium]
MKTTPTLRRHCNLYNGDCNVFFYNYATNRLQQKGGRFTKKAIHDFVDLLADSGVDTFLINPNGQVAWYPSKAIPTALDGYKRGDYKHFYGHILGQPMTHKQVDDYFAGFAKFMNRYLDLLEDDVDWLAEATKACRRRRISPWASVRMNDMHGANSFTGSFFNAPLLKDARFRLKGIQLNPKDGFSHSWMGLNYETHEVRDYMMRLIRELVEDYDFEGMELDWTRWILCCNPPASQKTTDIITAWHAEIRAFTEKRAWKTGKPYPLGLRFPGCFEMMRNHGLDVRAMVERGILDFLCPTNGWQTSWDMPLDRWKAEFGGKIAVYGVVEDAPNWLPVHSPKKKKGLPYRLLSASAELLRGNAAAKLALGADGIETFNFFCSDTPEHAHTLNVKADYRALKNLEKLDHLRGKPKHYTFSTGCGYYSMPPFFEFPEQFPVTLEPQWQRAFRLPLCAEPSGAGLQLLLQIVVEKGPNPPDHGKDHLGKGDLGVSFNGSWPSFDARPTQELLFATGALTHHVAENQAFNYRFKVADIREGWNEIVILNGSRKRASPQERRENSVCIVSIELAIKRPH